MNIIANEQVIEDVLYIEVEGEIDAYTAPQLKERAAAIEWTDETVVKMDLSKVTYMDSTGLGVFVGIYKRATAAGSAFQLRGLNDRLYRLFEITGLNEVIDIEKESGDLDAKI